MRNPRGPRLPNFAKVRAAERTREVRMMLTDEEHRHASAVAHARGFSVPELMRGLLAKEKP